MKWTRKLYEWMWGISGFALVFERDAEKAFRKLADKSRHKTIAATFCKAVSYYELFLDEQDAGGKIYIENPDGTRDYVKIQRGDDYHE